MANYLAGSENVSKFNAMASPTREEGALAVILNGDVKTALMILAELPAEDQYRLREAAQTLVALCKMPPSNWKPE